MIRPVKFSWIDANDLDSLDLRQWLAQQKMDGVRCMVEYDRGQVSFTGASGGRLVQAAAALHFDKVTAALTPLADVADHVVLDAELTPDTGVLHVFDVPLLDQLVIPSSHIEHRLSWAYVLATEVIDSAAVKPLPTATTPEQIVDLVDTVKFSAAEGVVLKKRFSPYPETQGSKDWLKLKFYREVDAVVTGRNVNGACNATLAVHDDAGQLVHIGSTSMIGKPDAQPGDVVEVKYLSWQPGGMLVQPSLLRVRDDKRSDECSIRQLVPSAREAVQL